MWKEREKRLNRQGSGTQTSSAESGWISPPWVPPHPNKRPAQNSLKPVFPSHRKWLFDQTCTLNLLNWGVQAYIIHIILSTTSLWRDPKRKKASLAPGSEAIKATPVTGMIEGKIGREGSNFSWAFAVWFHNFWIEATWQTKEDRRYEICFFFTAALPMAGKNLKTHFLLMCGKIKQEFYCPIAFATKYDWDFMAFFSIWRISYKSIPRQFFINQHNAFTKNMNPLLNLAIWGYYCIPC